MTVQEDPASRIPGEVLQALGFRAEEMERL